MDFPFVKANVSLDSLEEKQPHGAIPGPGPHLLIGEDGSNKIDPVSLDQEPKRRAKLDHSNGPCQQKTFN